jgi:hypothetical protein
MNDLSGRRADDQRRIDRVSWYHEIDSGNGLRSRSREPGIEGRYEFWRFIERTLDTMASLRLTYDVVLFLGVYHHLLDPMRAIINPPPFDLARYDPRFSAGDT